jgi:hypothetical protein
MSSDNFDHLIMGASVALAAKVKALLESSEEGTSLDTPYGDRFYVSQVVIKVAGDWGSEIVGYLVPDEADGTTFDFWTHRDGGDRATASSA